METRKGRSRYFKEELLVPVTTIEKSRKLSKDYLEPLKTNSSMIVSPLNYEDFDPNAYKFLLTRILL